MSASKRASHRQINKSACHRTAPSGRINTKKHVWEEVVDLTAFNKKGIIVNILLKYL